LLEGAPFNIAAMIQAVVSVVVIAATMILIRRTRDPHLRALLLASGTFLVSPYVFNYDMTLLSGALLWFIAPMTSISDRERWIFGAAWILPILIWPLHLYRVGIAPLMIGAVYVMTALLIQRAMRQGVQPSPATFHVASHPA
jgi:alpha-1,2-mannosyltransferase